MQIDIIVYAIIFLIVAAVVLRPRNRQQKNKDQKYEKRHLKKSEPFACKESLKTIDHNKGLIEIVRKNNYQTWPLLGYEERNVFDVLKANLHWDYYINPQASYGEFIKAAPKNDKARVPFNSKRVDFLITDRKFNPIAAIEYNGKRHFGDNEDYKNKAKKSDQIKYEVCQKAGLTFISLKAWEHNYEAYLVEKLRDAKLKLRNSTK